MVNATSGCWDLPRIAEKRNVYWDWRTVASLNNQTLEFGSIYNWNTGHLQRKDKPNDELFYKYLENKNTSISAIPKIENSWNSKELENLHIAVIVDTSYSMRNVLEKLKNSLKEIETLSNKNSIHLYITASEGKSNYSQQK